MSKYRSYTFYGRSGTGKTTLAGTFPGALFLDIKDQGTDSISDNEEAEVFDVKEWDDIEDAYWYLKKAKHSFKTVVLDTVSQLQQLCIIQQLEKKKKPTDRAGDWGTMTKRDWGDVGAKMKTWITRFRDLDMDVVFVAQDRIFNEGDEDDDTGGMIEPEVGPRLSPAVATHLNASVSFIGNTFIRQRSKTKKVGGKKKTRKIIEYCLRIGPDPVYITKTRKPKGIIPPSVLVDPGYEAIMDLIKGDA